MNIKFKIETSQLTEELNFSEKDVHTLHNVLKEQLSTAILNEWRKTAINKLNTTTSTYIQSMRYDLQKGYLELWLEGELANSIEYGMEAFDMKSGMLGSSNVKLNSDGLKYIRIPIGNDKNDSTAYQEHRIVIKDFFHQLKQQSRKGSTGRTFSIPESKYKPYVPKKAIIPKSSIALGVRELMNKEIRTVSEKSSPESWLHKGIEPRNFLESVLEGPVIEKTIDLTIESFLKNA